MFELQKLNELLPIVSDKPIRGFHTFEIDSNKVALVFRQGKYLRGILYVKSEKIFAEKWTEEVFQDDMDYSLEQYPWNIVEKLRHNNVKTIVMRHPDGIKIFELKEDYSGITWLSTDYNFHELNNLNVFIGNFYYSIGNFGIMSINKANEAKFYTINYNSLSKAIQQSNEMPILTLNDGKKLEEIASDSDVYLMKYKTGHNPIIITFNKDGLKMYLFSSKNELHFVGSSNHLVKNRVTDKLFIGDITGQQMPNILLLNDTGLHLYEHVQNKYNRYKLLSSDADFAVDAGHVSFDRDSIKLIDVDGDGKDELFFTNLKGLQGLKYDARLKYWVPILKDGGALLGSDRHSTLIGALKDNQSNPFLILQGPNGGLVFTEQKPSIRASLNALQSDLVKTVQAPVFIDGAPLKEIPEEHTMQLPHLRWIEQFDPNFIKKPVNLETGHVRFGIPLFDISGVTDWSLKCALTYSSDGIKSDLLGNGWALSMEPSYIFVDHQGSIFQEDFKYYLVNDGNQIALTYRNTAGKLRNYIIEGAIDKHGNDMIIQQDLEYQIWIIEGETERVVYGTVQNNNAILTRWTWKNWHGAGRGTMKQKPMIMAWYISYRHDILRRNQLTYKYHVNKEKINGEHEYVSGIQLTKIEVPGSLQINFQYNEGHLSQISIKTPVYLQQFEFQFNEEQGELVSIQQIFPERVQPILNFEYETLLGLRLMKRTIIVETDVSLNLAYSKVTPNKPIIGEENYISFSFKARPSFSFASDYAVALYRMNDKTAFKIFDEKLSKIEMECGEMEMFHCPELAHQEIISQRILTIKNSIAIIVDGKEKTFIFVYKRENGLWKGPRKHEFNPNTSIRTDAENRIVTLYSNDSVVKVYEPDESTGLWLEHSFKWTLTQPYTRFAVHNRLIIAYNDRKLEIAYKDIHQIWRTKVLNAEIPNMSFKHAMQRFDIKSDTRDHYVHQMNEYGLQLLNNLILITGMHVDEQKDTLNSTLYIILLDENYDVATVTPKEEKRDDILTLEFPVDMNNEDKNVKKVVMGYEKTGKTYKAVVKDLTNYRQMNNKNKNAIKTQFSEEFEKKLLFDLRHYTAYPSTNGVYWGTQHFLHYENDQWKSSVIPDEQSAALGRHLVLKTDDKNPLIMYLMRGKDTLHTLKMHSYGQFVTIYPAYIAYQSGKKEVTILTFKDDKTLEEEIVFKDEELLMESNVQNLLTWYDKDGHKSIRKRPVSTFVKPLSQPFVNEMHIKSDGILRPTKYEQLYSIDPDNAMITHQVKMIPGGDLTKHGWYEKNIVSNIKTGEVANEELWYDSNRDVVDFNRASQESYNNENKENKNNPAVLYDHMGRWPISDFTPFDLDYEMSSYYGFEPYESGQIGNKHVKKNWKKKGLLVKNFALTGKTFLQLQKKSILEADFTPNDQTKTYLAACWIRNNNLNEDIDSVVRYLKAQILTSNNKSLVVLLSQVKNHYMGWTYLELAIDMNQMHKIYQNYLGQSGMSEDLTINVTVTTDHLQTLDVDHIRFHPITHDFQATVYDEYTGQPIAAIHNSGLISKTIYNQFQQELATIQPNNEIIKLETKGVPIKFTSYGRLPQKMCKVTFEPTSGFYESFDRHSLHQHWDVTNMNQFQVSTGTLLHTERGGDVLVSKSGFLDSYSLGLRVYFLLQSEPSQIQFDYQGINVSIKKRNGNKALIIKQQKTLIQHLNHAFSYGELILLFEANALYIWLDGILVFDKEISIMSTQSNKLSIKFQNECAIKDMFVMNQPSVTVEYQNNLKEPTQILKLIDDNSAIISETLYDELGRDAIEASPMYAHRHASGSLLMYRPAFVLNRDPLTPESVWNAGKMYREFYDQLAGDGYLYKRTVYQQNPLNRPAKAGLPGADFEAFGSHAIHYSDDSEIPFLETLFPKKFKYTQKVKKLPNGSISVQIFDNQNSQVAEYKKVPGFEHTLATYEYNNRKNLVKILPPEYHRIINTFERTWAWIPGDLNETKEELELQKQLSTTFNYDIDGKLISKKTPDTGTQKFLYNSAGQMRFMVQMDIEEDNPEVVYYNYDENGQITSTGFLTTIIPLTELEKYVDSQILPLNQVYQSFDYSNENRNPMVRGFTKICVTYGTNHRLIEKLKYDEQEHLISKETVPDNNFNSQLTDVQKEYIAGRVSALIYSNGLRLKHKYNKLGQLIALGTEENEIQFGVFHYTSNGKLEIEEHQYFKRKYKYNSPGWLTLITDQFLAETLTYLKNGYGQNGFGDGIIMSSTYKPKWHDKFNKAEFKITEDNNDELAANCIQKLKDQNYLNSEGYPLMMYIPAAEYQMPLECDALGDKLAELVASKLKSVNYGHRYTYSNNHELLKAKFFMEDRYREAQPLQLRSFKAFDLNAEAAEQLWIDLVKEGFVYEDTFHEDKAFAQGVIGKALYRRDDLINDLKQLNPIYIKYENPIAKLFMDRISMKRKISLPEFIEIFKLWENYETVDDAQKLEINETAENVGSMLVQRRYMPEEITSTSFLNQKLIKILLNYGEEYFYKILRTLAIHFTHQLGQTPFDVQSNKIDSNGNHQLFYSGNKRYELEYNLGTNQINSVKVGSRYDEINNAGDKLGDHYEMKHDKFGNVVKAMHKNILQVTYHPVSQRPTSMILTDETRIYFYYDARGERIMKRVFAKGKGLSQETFYVRDEKGRVLTDRVTKYQPKPMEILTNYIYGPRGLVGFVRDDVFYQVFSDHLESVRLVIRDGKVVAAYDYLPYGGIMRTFGSDPFVQINYRYLGQEFDEETGLYNFHARLYDPAIGRFFQPDPMLQFFSPYKYAGNSPITLLDPEGEIVPLVLLVLIGVGAIAGAYLGGAAANDDWNPAGWEWSSSTTWIGIVGGGIGGALMPIFLPQSIATFGYIGTITLGVGTAVSLGAASQGTFDPTKWAWDRPALWNSFFQGFGMGAGAGGAIAGVHQFAGKFATVAGQRLFLSASYGVAAAMAYAGGAGVNNWEPLFWKWDWKNPQTLAAMVEGFYGGIMMLRSAKEGIKTAKELYRSFKAPSTTTYLEKIANVLKNPTSPLYEVLGGLVMGYFFASAANGEFDITKWNLASMSTYQGFSRGVFFGGTMNKFVVSLHKIPCAGCTFTMGAYRRIKSADYAGEERQRLITRLLSNYEDAQYNLFIDKYLKHDQKLLSDIKNSNLLSDDDIKIFLNEYQSGSIPEKLRKYLKTTLVDESESLLNKFQKWTDENQKLIQEQATIFVEHFKSYMPCTVTKSSSGHECYIAPQKLTNPTQKFMNDPVSFLSQHVVTMENLAVEYKGNSKFLYKFELQEKNYGYALTPARDNAETHNIVEGVFLHVMSHRRQDHLLNEMLFEIDNSVKFIFTPELETATIGFSVDNNMLKLNRVEPDPLEAICINDVDGEKLFKDKQLYLTKRGEPINELKNVDSLIYYMDMNVAEKDGVCILLDPMETLYYFSVSANGKKEWHEIETINNQRTARAKYINKDKKENYQQFKSKYNVFEYETQAGYQFDPVKKTVGAVIYQDKEGIQLLYQKHESRMIDGNEKTFTMSPEGVQGRIIMKKHHHATPMAAVINKNAAPSNTENIYKHVSVESKYYKPPPPASSNSSGITSNYTSWHLNGMLQLIDLGVKKILGEKYSNINTRSLLTWEDATIEATEIVDELEAALEDTLGSIFHPTDSLNFGSYELYQKVANKMVAGDIRGVYDLLEKTVQDVIDNLKDELDDWKLDDLSKGLQTSLSKLYKRLLKFKKEKNI